MKGQGLPINFIVLAALAILVMISAAVFIISSKGSAERTLSPQEVRQTCLNACNTLKNIASTMQTAQKGEIIQDQSPYCNKYTVSGIKGTCVDPGIDVPCTVTFEDGTSCKISCTYITLQSACRPPECIPSPSPKYDHPALCS